jgi:hypothetical protein
MRSKLHRLDAQLRPKFVDTGTPDHAQVTDMLAELICCGLGDRRSIIRSIDRNEIIDAGRVGKCQRTTPIFFATRAVSGLRIAGVSATTSPEKE